MTERPRLMDHPGEVPAPPRMLRNQRHEQLDILAVALCTIGLITGPKWSNLANPNWRGSPHF